MGRTLVGRDGVFRTHARNAAHAPICGGMVMPERSFDISSPLGVALYTQNKTTPWLAEQLCVKPQTVQNWLYIGNGTTKNMIQRICSILGVPFELFFSECVVKYYNAHNHRTKRNYTTKTNIVEYRMQFGCDPDFISDFPVRNANGKWVQ
jgi:hypothetical protein